MVCYRCPGRWLRLPSTIHLSTIYILSTIITTIPDTCTGVRDGSVSPLPGVQADSVSPVAGVQAGSVSPVAGVRGGGRAGGGGCGAGGGGPGGQAAGGTGRRAAVARGESQQLPARLGAAPLADQQPGRECRALHAGPALRLQTEGAVQQRTRAAPHVTERDLLQADTG